MKNADDMHVFRCKYIFKVKLGGPKARLVVLGCRQLHGIDYNETFAPVFKLSTLRIIFAMVAHYDLECEEMDVVTAFLNGDLSENIFKQIPQGFKCPENQGMVCKLNKSLYGLKQAPRQWFAKIHKYLTEDLHFSE